MPNPLADPSLEVSTEQVARALAERGAQVVDVREPYEREAGHIPGTRHIELERLGSQAPTLDRERPVVFVCRAGVRSLLAAQAFRRAGFDASSMAGGMEQWHAEGRAMEPPDGVVAPH
jgi:hydroxyacylglutathione hydrolase/adenylyltransferase/sulfurtransferase